MRTAMKPQRPTLKYFGGKWRMADWIASHFPPHRNYVEPFGGAASVLLKKERAEVEIYNDINEDVVNFFRLLRNKEQAAELKRLCELTPYARSEHQFCQESLPSTCPIESARRFVFLSYASYPCGPLERKNFLMADTSRKARGYEKSWANYPENLAALCERLKMVTIENMDAFKLIDRCDSKDSLFYIDPPYLPSTRTNRFYKNELTEEDHISLSAKLKSIRGRVVLSAYDSPLYEELYKDWNTKSRKVKNTEHKERTEKLYLNFVTEEEIAVKLHFNF